MGRMAYQRTELKIGPRLSLLLRYAFKAAALILVIISLNFLLIHLMPGDAIMHILGEEQYYALTNQFPERLEEVKRNYSLDGSLFSQYLRFMYNVITFRFGQSYVDGTSVTDNVFFRLRWTLTLSLCAIVISALFGGALGVVAGALVTVHHVAAGNMIIGVHDSRLAINDDLARRIMVESA